MHLLRATIHISFTGILYPISLTHFLTQSVLLPFAGWEDDPNDDDNEMGKASEEANGVSNGD